ncbi:MAG: hypothetical protein JW768_08110 [Chitinispirillaceae bacterium]|nr:hypothetical protein [Chitinispirillaceae bacterium]
MSRKAEKPSRTARVFGGGTIRACVMLMVITGLGVGAQTRLDLFDEQGNHLMFVTFEYDVDQKNISRSVYMSDSTFVRKVVFTKDAQGRSLKETSFNFHDDTVFSTTLEHNGEATVISIRDQFGLDQMGGPVRHSAAGQNSFDFFQKDALINKMGYEYDNEGKLSKVNVYDGAGARIYYGTFSYGGPDGVVTPGKRRAARAAITGRGRNVLLVQFHLERQSQVRCELVSLSGKRIALLFSGTVPYGTQKRTIRIGETPSISAAPGVYLVNLTINGAMAARKKVFIQNYGGGSK